MKKTLKVLGLLVFAAAMFAGCKKDTDDGPRDIAAPLFDETVLTVPASRVDLKNEKWTIRRIEVEEDGIQREGAEITCSITSAGRVDTTVDFDFVATGIIEAPRELTSYEKQFYEALGYTVNGKNASYCYEMNKKKYDEISENYSSAAIMSTLDPSDPDFANYKAMSYFSNFCSSIYACEGYSYYFDSGSIVTNDDKSKYYAEDDERKWYFSKVE